jgi:signal transduction histidine kinase
MHRLERLLDLGPTLVAELDLDAVLDHLLETACEITGARYAALGILDERRRGLSAFLTRGVDDATRARIGDPPRGRGVLGLIVDDLRPLRLDDVTKHPQSYGFPPGHPPMKTFLGVPVIIRGQAWGNLYLTEKEGGEPFDEGDERAVVTLAAWASIAIENARLYEAAERRSAELERAVRGLEATSAIARAVGAETSSDSILQLIVDRGRSLIGARRVVAALARGGELSVVAGAGEADDPPPGLLDEVFRTGEPHRDDDGLVVPMRYRTRTVGVLAALRDPGGRDAFTDEDEELLVSFAASAATAVATAQTVERDRLRYALQAAEEERRRWARELHDETLQALGALRLSLAAAAREPDPDRLRELVREAVGQIQGEVANLRAIITDLRPAALDQLGLEPALEALVSRVASVEGLDIETDLELRPLDGEVETTIYRLVQESLTNIARHAAANHVSVSVHAGDERVEIEVRDDGRGFDPEADVGGFGLRGMRERVALVGGTLELTSGMGGTTVRASVPVVPEGPALGL